MLSQFISWIIKYQAPLLLMAFGVAVLALVAYVNWHGSFKAKSIRWIVDTVYHKDELSKKLADNLFMSITSILVLLGGLLVLLSLLFLWG